jgi:transcriptional regulator with XRE-family HTH domain
VTTRNRKATASAAMLPQDDGHQPAAIAAAIRSTPPAAWLSQPQKNHEDTEMQEAAPTERLRTKPQAAAVKMIGARLREAREMNNLSLSEAARRLGYSNPSKLSKVENASDTNSVPLWLIRDAAELYDVSADYIFGLADDWETGIPRGMTGWLADRWEQLRRRDVAAMAALGARVDTCATLIPTLAQDAKAVLDAIRRLETLNPDTWPEIKGGSKLTAAAERLERSANSAAVAEKRLRIELHNATAENEQ